MKKFNKELVKATLKFVAGAAIAEFSAYQLGKANEKRKIVSLWKTFHDDGVMKFFDHNGNELSIEEFHEQFFGGF